MSKNYWTSVLCSRRLPKNGTPVSKSLILIMNCILLSDLLVYVLTVNISALYMKT